MTPIPYQTPAGRAVNMVLVPPETVARMRRHLDGRTDAALNARFGISYNTWRKLDAGEPVRASVATRLASRLSSLEASQHGIAHG